MEAVRKTNPFCNTAFEVVEKYLQGLTVSGVTENTIRQIAIPVLYNGADLDFIAAEKNISVNQIIELHASAVYHVYMIGFLPGFAYMGTVATQIAVPRKDRPRKMVPPGSVGIAGQQTGIYPVASPGGWQLIGQTPLKIFDSKKESPCLLQAGDEVRFEAISKATFEKLNEY